MRDTPCRERPSVIGVALALLACACSEPTGPAPTRLEIEGTVLASGFGYSCLLDSLGEAICWGWGLGLPTHVAPGDRSRRLVTISAGTHTCGLTGDGTAFCWGANRYGELGDGTRQARSVPTRVATTVRFAAISAGLYSTCALRVDGRAYCWGRNDFGALGNGTMAEGSYVPRPMPVATSLRFRAIGGGSTYCGLTFDDRVFCWGAVSGSFDLGPRPGDCATTYDDWYQGRQCVVPTPVAGGLAFGTLAAGIPRCALTRSGAAYCWGEGRLGTLGNGSFGSGVHAVEPVAVSGGLTFASITSGWGHVCALATDGRAYCWGNNFVGQVGNGEGGRGGWGIPVEPQPVAVAGDHRFVAIAAGAGHTCALTGTREVWCWGSGSSGELGRDPALLPLGNSNVPIRVQLP